MFILWGELLLDLAYETFELVERDSREMNKQQIYEGHVLTEPLLNPSPLPFSTSFYAIFNIYCHVHYLWRA